MLSRCACSAGSLPHLRSLYWLGAVNAACGRGQQRYSANGNSTPVQAAAAAKVPEYRKAPSNRTSAAAAAAAAAQEPPQHAEHKFPPLHAEILAGPECSTVSNDDFFRGVSSAPFTAEQSAILQAPIDIEDIDIKPDGVVYLTEIKYRRILNRAFNPGGWGLVPRGKHALSNAVLSCEYALFVNGRFVALARGEQAVHDERKLVTYMEGVKSNALVRCCKDIGIASELWDPNFLRKFKASRAEQVLVRHVTRGTRSYIWRLRGTPVIYPHEEIKNTK